MDPFRNNGKHIDRNPRYADSALAIWAIYLHNFSEVKAKEKYLNSYI